MHLKFYPIESDLRDESLRRRKNYIPIMCVLRFQKVLFKNQDLNIYSSRSSIRL